MKGGGRDEKTAVGYYPYPNEAGTVTAKIELTDSAK
jgi:hypothetical protein